MGELNSPPRLRRPSNDDLSRETFVPDRKNELFMHYIQFSCDFHDHHRLENIFEHLLITPAPSTILSIPTSPARKTCRSKATKTLGGRIEVGVGWKGRVCTSTNAKIETTRGVSQFVRMDRNKNNASGGYYDESTLSAN